MCDGTVETWLCYFSVVDNHPGGNHHLVWIFITLYLCLYMTYMARKTFTYLSVSIRILYSLWVIESLRTEARKGRQRCTNDVDAPKTIDLFVVWRRSPEEVVKLGVVRNFRFVCFQGKRRSINSASLRGHVTSKPLPFLFTLTPCLLLSFWVKMSC